MKVEIRDEDLILVEQAVDVLSGLVFNQTKRLQEMHINMPSKVSKKHFDDIVHEWDRQMGYYFRLRRISEDLEKSRKGGVKHE